MSKTATEERVSDVYVHLTGKIGDRVDYGVVENSEEVHERVILDFDHDGNLYGIEILGATHVQFSKEGKFSD